MSNDLKPQKRKQETFISRPTLRIRSGFAIPHLLAASKFAKTATEIENAHKHEELSNIYDDIRFNVLAAVMLSVAALEANINEHLADEQSLPELDIPAHQTVVELLESQPILEKYQKVLGLLNLELVDSSREPYQSARGLIQLRNALVHFKPEWHDEQVEHAKLGERLKGKFRLSPFFQETHVLFPDRILGASCANWAVRTSLEFMKHFHVLSESNFKFGDDLYAEYISKHSDDA